MCPPDQTDDDPEDAAADSDSGGGEAPHEPNKVVGPLTEDELQAGGLDRTVSYIRSERTKESIRKERQRNKQQQEHGKRQMNIVVRDDDRSRATMRGAATALEDEAAHKAFEAILAKPDIAPLVADVATQAELREIIELARSLGDRRHSATAELLDTAKLVVEHPEIVALMTRAAATSRMRETMELAVANPAFVLLGRIVATQRSVCAWLARLLLRVRRRPDAEHSE